MVIKSRIKNFEDLVLGIKQIRRGHIRYLGGRKNRFFFGFLIGNL